MRVIVFEDNLVPRLYPITTGRLTYAVTCGSYRLVDWLRALGCPLAGVVRRHLQDIQRIDFADLANGSATEAASSNGSPSGADAKQTLWINARVVPSLSAFKTLQRWIGEGRPGVVRQGEEIAAVLFSRDAPTPPARLEVEDLPAYFEQAGLSRLETAPLELPLFVYPHDVVRQNMLLLGESLQHRLTQGGYEEIADGVFAAPGASLGPYAVSNTRQGPIVLDAGADVGAFCLLRGPVYIGQNARINEHSAIKDAVSLGHTTKIGGEVEASVVEPYTNKQHHGFLGHSYLGSWINLGAGTCNSDLKNSYGNVKMEYQGVQVSTGMQFVGCAMGDYAKTAINTGIFTGKTIGACSMMYGFVTTNVPSFVNYARLFGQVTELPSEIMIATQQRMFARRKVVQRPCDMQLLHAMYELTRHERQLAGEPLSL